MHSLGDALADRARCKYSRKAAFAAATLAPVHQIAAQAEPSVLQQQRLILVGDQREPVGASEVEESLAVAILAQDPRGVEIAPLGKVL